MKFPMIHFSAAEWHYQMSGYKPIEAPWIVGQEAYDATKPSDVRDFATIGGNLVASGEQSFLQLMLDGVMPGKAQCITPCFRDEAYDEIHLPYFLKLELIDTINVTEASLKIVIEDALGFFRAYLSVELVDMGDGSFDIVASKNGIELGSYGIRHYKHFSWVYGTGLAEPRLSQAMEVSK